MDSESGRVGSYRSAAAVGAAAGLAAATVQTGIGLFIDKALLPPQHDNNISPRLVNRLFRRAGHGSDPVRDWVLGTLFHLGYGVVWGAAFGLVRRWSRLPALALAPGLAGLIYALAFSRQGVGTRTGTERHPDRRPANKQRSLVAVVAAYALSLAWLFDRLWDGSAET